ncbi:MAG: subtype A tannase [Atopobiaceae bacterium]
MRCTRRDFLFLLSTATMGSLAACSAGGTSSQGTGTGSTSKKDYSSLAIDMNKWSHDDDNDVWYQIGLTYCLSPQATDYESLGIYVPGAYLKGTKNSDGTYACKVNPSASVGDYTAATAPFVLPVNTAGYVAQAAPTSYSYNGLSEYLAAGLVYVYAGCRGRYDSSGDDFPAGAPWGVTDLKAAIRYVRYNKSSLPGDATRVFTFGHSGGGAQSALVGATGDSELYTQYLDAIGAALTDSAGSAISDATTGAMCWCPITSLDEADEAYEWMMGQYASTGTRASGTFTKLLSDDLSKAFASYVNDMDLRDPKGTVLRLSETSDGIFTSGTYYDYVKSTIETSLNNFLSDTTFPYTPSNAMQADMGAGGGGTSGGMRGGAMSGGAPSGSLPDTSSGSAPSGSAPSGATGGSAPSGGAGMTGGSTSSSDSTTYNTVDEYLASLNSDETWVVYDSSSNTATITSVGAFVRHCKTASKDVCAFDSLSKTQAENYVFGTSGNPGGHFDPTISDLLSKNKDAYAAASNWDSSYPDSYANDLKNTDSLGSSVTTRMGMYNPMYFLSGHYDGYGKSTPAAHWRIHTGINQGDTSLTTEMNLALALQHYDGVKDVDLTTVWGLGHTTAERTGSSSTNFISWVASSLK